MWEGLLRNISKEKVEMVENSNGLCFWVSQIAAKCTERQLKQECTLHSAVPAAMLRKKKRKNKKRFGHRAEMEKQQLVKETFCSVSPQTLSPSMRLLNNENTCMMSGFLWDAGQQHRMAWPCLQQAGQFATAPVPAKLVDSHLKCHL